MTPIKRISRLLTVPSLLILAACNGAGDGAVTESEQDSGPAAKPAAVTVDTKPAGKANPSDSPGKPSAPIHFRYEIQGTPVVGQPVSINVFVTSSAKGMPIKLMYRVNDASAIMFPESQAMRTEIVAAADDEGLRPQQITVIPQREGRLYLNVSAEIETANGTMLKTTAIPIQVGSAPPELKVNGELIETEEGETVISMPAN